MKRVGFNKDDFELLICDQGTQNIDFLNFLTSLNPHYFRPNRYNEGICRSLNQLILRATGKHVFYLPSDVIMPWNWCDKLYEAAEDIEDSAILTFQGQNLILPETKLKGKSGKEWLIGLKPGKELNNECMVLGPVLLTQKYLSLVGAFHEGFHPYGCEDFDICYRARLLGLKVYYLIGEKYENKDQKEIVDTAYEKFKTMMNEAQVGHLQWRAMNYERIGMFEPFPPLKPPMGYS